MKFTFLVLSIALSFVPRARAEIIIPGANGGSDGPLVVTGNTVIDLSQANSGSTVTWDTSAATPGKGVYDASKWAVVFKYSSVSIQQGATVTFKNHPSRAPVVWLVNGNVQIDGTINLNGENGASAPALAEPGPGGFRGGAGSYTSNVFGSPGFGVGGGRRLGHGDGGSYGSLGNSNYASFPPLVYGNPSLVPLIGGSGGAGTTSSGSGGAGGGAILIACKNSISVNGSISCKGGNGFSSGATGGGGSGGGVRLIGDTVSGTGTVTATGGAGSAFLGGLGRIRVERVATDNLLTIVPLNPSVVPLSAGDTALLWPPDNAPAVKIVSIGGVLAPGDPRASFGAAGADVALAETATTQIVIETKNVAPDAGTQVKVRLTPRSNGDYTEVNAAVSSVNGTTVLWTANVAVNVGYAAVQVKVVRP